MCGGLVFAALDIGQSNTNLQQCNTKLTELFMAAKIT